MATYTTKLYDRIDKICHRYYGTANDGVVEWIIANNPGVEQHKIMLPPGITINLPDRPKSNTTPVIKQVHLWT